MNCLPPMNSLARLAVLLLIACAVPAWAQQAPSKRVVIRAPQAKVAPPPGSTDIGPTEQLPAAHLDTPTRIEQVRQGRRITEVVVTPQGYSHSYAMAHPELKPLKDGPTDNGAGLSVPRFVRFSF